MKNHIKHQETNQVVKNRMVSILNKISNWLENNSAMVTTIATVVLALLTFFYLRETRKQRVLTEKVVWVQTAPKVFIKNIESRVNPDYDTNELVVHSIIIFTNCGKTEAKNLFWSYTIKQGEQELVKEDKRQAPYVYPEQNYGTAMPDFRIKRSEEDMEIIRKAQSLKKSITISPSVLRPIILNIEFGYEDSDGKRIQSHQEQYKYLLHMGQWVIPITEE